LTTPSGVSKVIPLEGYVEPGYFGWIWAEVTAAGGGTVRKYIVP
jgi:hypothetical protein